MRLLGLTSERLADGVPLSARVRVEVAEGHRAHRRGGLQVLLGGRAQVVLLGVQVALGGRDRGVPEHGLHDVDRVALGEQRRVGVPQPVPGNPRHVASGHPTGKMGPPRGGHRRSTPGTLLPLPSVNPSVSLRFADEIAHKSQLGGGCRPGR